MPRPTATSALLVVAAVARGAGIVAATDPTTGFDLVTAVVWVEVAVPLVLAALDHRGATAAASGALTLGALGAARLMSVGLAATAGVVPLTAPLVGLLVASGAAALAAAAVVGRWQDRGAPAAGRGRTWPRVVTVVGAVLLGLSLVTVDVALLGLVELDVVTVPGPVALASTVDLRQLPLLVGVLAPVAWVVTRADDQHLRAVSLVLGARTLVEVAADAALLPLGGPVWPVAVLGAGAFALLLVVPAATSAQVTSSSA